MPRTEPKQGWRGLVAVATTAPYCWYLIGQAADTIALWMQRLALGWLVWELTQSTAWLGTISFLKFAPTMVLGLFGGVIADRFSRGPIVVAAQAVTVFKATAVAILIVAGAISLPVLLALTLLVGVAVGLSQASSKAMIHELVPRANVPAAIALNSVLFNVSQLVGPALAGLVIVFFDTLTCFVVIAVLFAVNLAVFAVILPRISAPPARPAAEPMLRAIGTALAFCARHRAIAPLLVLHFVFTFAVRPIIDMLPAFAGGGVLDDGVDAVSLLTSTIGLGAIASGLYVATRPHGAGLLRLVLAAMLVLGAAIVGFAFSPTLPVAVAMAALIGGGMAVRAAGVQTLVQLAAAEDLRGRVLSVYVLGLNTGASLGAIGVGALAELVGLRWALAAVGGTALIVLGVVVLRRHEMEAALDLKEKP